ncbi:MAG: nucleotide exchange factor GrpE [Chromatiales bacterium]|jgi:molecular chaperone GrpE|nr:nucleotide exchange factor GrpE [Chromatiales bacterium]MDX9766344.1 nucleotide exchange factor GrpE [Ectothiorhodospiraceae bacterium]
MSNEEQTPVEAAGSDPAGGDNPHPEFNPATLLKQLEEAQAEAQQQRDALLRTQAEMDNLRKRMARDMENAHKYALERFAAELLGVRDSLELGVDAAQEAADVAKIREGTELTLRLLAQAMTKFGIEEIDPRGERFDPEQHQAMSMQESSEHAPNTVLAVMQKGYRLNDRLLRPAMVVVCRAPEGG